MVDKEQKATTEMLHFITMIVATLAFLASVFLAGKVIDTNNRIEMLDLKVTGCTTLIRRAASVCWEKHGWHYRCNAERPDCLGLCLELEQRCAKMLSMVTHMSGKDILSVIN